MNLPQMKLQKQPFEWACLPTAFAMLIDQPVESIIIQIGHDGSEIVFPNHSGALAHRSFHPQEIVDLAESEYKIALVSIELNPATMLSPYETYQIYENYDSRANYHLGYRGILIGQINANCGHAMAWDGTHAYDPKEPKIHDDLDSAFNSLSHFYRAYRIKSDF